MLLDHLRETFFSSLICTEGGEPSRPLITTIAAKTPTYYNPSYNARWASNMGKNKNVSLTHAQVWDDSALVQSWDDAVEEYQVSHQIFNSRDQYLT
jgi:hypothetical protein